jgi:hypothetical protein
MTKKKECERQKTLPKTTKSQGPLPSRRSNFLEKMISKDESQALDGAQKFSTRILQETNSPTATHVEDHRGTKGTEQSFQNTHTPLFSPLDEGNSCNFKEG